MPEAMKRKLRATAAKKGLTGDAKNAYVYGTMQKTTDWKPKKKKRKYKKFTGRM